MSSERMERRVALAQGQARPTLRAAAAFAVVAPLVGAGTVAVVAAGCWAVDTGWRATRLLTDHEPVELLR